MRYNYEIIGQRITKERKAAGFSSMEKLCNYLRDKYSYSMKRATLGKIEKGKTTHYDCELLYILCEIFDCEMGYLLGEYDCKTGRNTDISREIGISEIAANKLRSMYFENGANGLSDVFTILIEHQSFQYLLALIGDNASGTCEHVYVGDTNLQPDKKDVINSALKDAVIQIASDIRKEYTPNAHSIEYHFLFSLYREGKITHEEMQDIKRHYDDGDFEYVPNKVHLRLLKQKRNAPKRNAPNK